MFKTVQRNLPTLYIGGDVFTLFLTSFISIYFFSNKVNSPTEWTILPGFIILWFLVGHWRKLYNLNLDHDFGLRVFNYLKTYFIILVLVFIILYLFRIPRPDEDVVAAFVIGFPVLSITINFLIITLLTTLKNREANVKFTLIAGVGELAENVEKHFSARESEGYQIKGFINCKKENCQVPQNKVVGDLENIHQYLKDNPVDEIVIALPVKTSKKIRSIIGAADYHGVRVTYIPDYGNLLGKNYKATQYAHIDAVKVRQMPLDERYAFFLKNSFDKLFSAGILLFLSPVFLLIALLIKLDSPGPVFYCPIRIGRGGRPFKVYKFRSMRENDAANGGSLSTQVDDARITKIGKFLRKYSLDELPQFINVLFGEMSVVGPRPHRSFLNQQLQESVNNYMLRHYFKPGITGWAQVNGWRGPTDTEEQRTQRTAHDLWYQENWSLALDLKIIFLTVFSRKVHSTAF